jgi:hypothetical protein
MQNFFLWKKVAHKFELLLKFSDNCPKETIAPNAKNRPIWSPCSAAATDLTRWRGTSIE